MNALSESDFRQPGLAACGRKVLRIVVMLLAAIVFASIVPALLHAQDFAAEGKENASTQIAASQSGNSQLRNPLPATDQLLGPTSAAIPFPAKGVTVNGFRGAVRFGSTTSSGTLPVEIQVDAVGTFAADRSLVFQFVAARGDVAPPRRGLSVEVEVNAQQGTKSLRQIYYLPKWASARVMTFQVFEDRSRLDGYQGSSLMPSVSDATNRNEALEIESFREYSLDYLLFVNPDAEATETLLAKDYAAFHSLPVSKIDGRVLVDRRERDWVDVLYQLGQQEVSVSQNVSIELTNQAPTNWKAYQAFDCVCVSQATLVDWSNRFPTQMSALRQWIMMGGTLVVRADGIDQTERWSQAHQAVEAMGGSPTANLSDEELEEAVSDMKWVWKRATEKVSASLPATDFRPAMDLDPSQWSKRIDVATFGGGSVVLLTPRKQDYENAIVVRSLELVGHMLPYGPSPMLRRGVEPMIGDNRFRKFLIRGVAEPPVYTFMGLLTAFVVLVGPIAYRQTTLAKRSHLMFAIAPVLAIFTTVLMFGYGLIADGLGTTARLRQITFVDAGSGDAVQRCRSSYFAGLSPNDRLRFPSESEVVIYPNSSEASLQEQMEYSESVLADVYLTPETQSFSSSLIPSRTMTQFVTHRPIPKLGRLEVDEAMTADRSKLDPSKRGLTITNRFDFTLRRLILRDRDGEYWQIEQIDPRETKRATFLMRKKSSAKLGGLYNDFRLVMPTGENRSRKDRDGGRFDLIARISQQHQAGGVLQDGTIEGRLQKFLQTDVELPTGHFVAIADPDLDSLLVEEAELVDSVRYLAGTFHAVNLKVEEPATKEPIEERSNPSGPNRKRQDP